METNRFAVVTAPRSVEVQEEELRQPGAGEVLVRIRYCGVCATDTHGYSSGGLIPKAVFGHEWTGSVVTVGAGVDTVAEGDRVVASVGPACGICPMCRAGNADHCDTAFAEANGVTEDAPDHGGFSEHLIVSERRVQRALESLTDEQLGLVEPTAVTFHAVRRTGQRLGAVVVVQGAGPIGLLTAQHARHAGAGAVVVVEPSEARRDAARALGFTEVFEPGDEFRARVLELTGTLGADVLYECTGAPALLQPSAELVRRGGILSLLGYPMTDSEVSYGDWQSRELTVIGSLAYTHADFTGAMRALADGSVDVVPLITGTITLDELPDLLAELDGGTTQHAKVLVAPNAGA
ncbi:alcohol dehydrogenase [Arthrobacter sp. RIT-PI-e]|uniref:zinc-dependent alcohol dehydrogenase n=1 Tax=Arthrobacter sp. RIT-PI-e TaxID=1681197 RepID=UPI000675C882|nr:zinc-binding dehydrogenase [Arthrobacter sp. RIT-PI-e]KNC19867.1 alcohol dehydrogenase [Arthrobacter sp. RIT-PI-e]